jgi:hypothetical protein
MRPDIYTKSVLTVIALLLAMLVGKQYLSPDSVAYAQGSFAGVQFSGNGSYWGFFDTRNGDLWHFNSSDGWQYQGRVPALGQPLTKRMK